MDRIKVLIVPSWYPNGQDRLMGQYHLEYAAALAADGRFDVSMLVIDRARLKAPVDFLRRPRRFTVQHDGFCAYGLRMLNVAPISFDWQQRRYQKALLRAYRIYEKQLGRPDVIHAMVTVPAGAAACRLGRELGVPVLITEHASYYRRFFEGKESRYGAYAAQYASFSAVSRFVADGMSECTGRPCAVLPNVVDTAVFQPHARRQPDGTLRLLIVSALRQGKRIDDAADAVRLLLESGRFRDVRCTVAGDGFWQQRYIDAVRGKGMDGHFDFVGRKTKPELAGLLRQTDLLLVTSEFETFCIPAVEALAAGVPVVSTRCRGPEEFITPVCGELCRAADPADMAAAIGRACDRLDSFDPAAMAAAAARFSGPSVADAAHDIYCRLPGGHFNDKSEE